jgi:hypothetical protein
VKSSVTIAGEAVADEFNAAILSKHRPVVGRATLPFVTLHLLREFERLNSCARRAYSTLTASPRRIEPPRSTVAWANARDAREELSGGERKVDDHPMTTTSARPQQRYDHRLRDLVQRTGDMTIATDLGVPRSTARGWQRGKAPKVVVSLGRDGPEGIGTSATSPGAPPTGQRSSRHSFDSRSPCSEARDLR